MYIKNPEYFLTTVKAGSISKAAEELYLSQPYLSQCIARLERELGFKLFDRSHAPLQLTEAGKLYLSYLEKVGVITDRFESRLEELRTGTKRVINVGMTLWRGSVLLPDILPTFAETHPDTRIILHEYHSNKLMELLSTDQIDFALMNIPENVDDFVYDMVINERLLLVVSRNHPAIQGMETSLDDPAFIDLTSLKKERFILLPEEQVMGRSMKNLFAKMEMSDCDILYTTSSTTSVNLAAEGFGITFLPEGGLRHVAHKDRLAFFTVDNPSFSVPLLVLYKKNSVVTPQARDFINMTRACYAAVQGN